MDDLPLQPVTREDSFLLRLPIADADLLAVFFNPDGEGDGRPTCTSEGAPTAALEAPVCLGRRAHGVTEVGSGASPTV